MFSGKSCQKVLAPFNESMYCWTLCKVWFCCCITGLVPTPALFPRKPKSLFKDTHPHLMLGGMVFVRVKFSNWRMAYCKSSIWFPTLRSLSGSIRHSGLKKFKYCTFLFWPSTLIGRIMPVVTWKLKYNSNQEIPHLIAGELSCCTSVDHVSDETHNQIACANLTPCKLAKAKCGDNSTCTKVSPYVNEQFCKTTSAWLPKASGCWSPSKACAGFSLCTSDCFSVFANCCAQLRLIAVAKWSILSRYCRSFLRCSLAAWSKSSISLGIRFNDNEQATSAKWLPTIDHKSS